MKVPFLKMLLGLAIGIGAVEVTAPAWGQENGQENVAGEAPAEDAQKVGPFKICPVVKFMNFGSYSLFYALEHHAGELNPCKNPQAWYGPNDASTGNCGDGSGCLEVPEALLLLKAKMSKKGAFHSDTGNNGLGSQAKDEGFIPVYDSASVNILKPFVVRFEALKKNNKVELLHAKLFLVELTPPIASGLPPLVIGTGCEIKAPNGPVQQTVSIANVQNVHQRACTIQVGSVTYDVVTKTQLLVE